MTTFINNNKTVPIPRLSSSEFNRAVRNLDLPPHHIDRAKQVMVRRTPAKKVAVDNNVSYEAIRVICARILAQVKQFQKPITEVQFQHAVNQMPRLSEKNKKLIYRVIVKNEEAKNVAESAGIRLATLKQKIARVKENILPDGWKQVSGVLPVDQAEKVEAMFDLALKKLNK